jgi:hypothetical protein
LNGIGFTVSGALSAIPVSENLSVSDYSYNPGSANQQVLQYKGGSIVTVTFGSVMPSLELFDVFWRNDGNYTFTQPYTILSGNGSVTVVDSTTLQPGAGFNSGVLGFSNVSSLTFSPANTADTSFQAMTLGVGGVAASVPEPATLSLLGLGTAAIFLVRRRLARR